MAGTINAGAISVLVDADIAAAQSSFDKVGATAEREMKRIERAQIAAKAEGDRFIAMLQKQVDTVGLTGTALLRYEAGIKGVAQQAQPLIDKLDSLKRAQQAVSQQSTAGVGALAKGFDDAAAGAEHASRGTAGITRELLVLGHEASQGNFKRFGGSLLVLAEYSATAQAAIRAMVGPVGAVVAVLGAFAVAAVAGARETTQLNRALQLSGNYAGVTASSFSDMARKLAESTNSGVGAARTALEEIVKTGDIGPRLIAPVGAAVLQLERLTGESSESIVKDFAKMGDGVAKWAAEHNKAYNFLTAAQYDYIKALEEQGHKEDAELEVLRRLNEHLGVELPQNLGILERAWRSLTRTASETWDAMKGIGRAATVDDEIAKQTARIDAIRMAANAKPVLGSSNLPKFDTTAAEAAAVDDLRLAKLAKTHEAEQALSVATQARYQKAGIAASDYFTKLDEERKGTTRLAKDLEELQAKIKARADAGGPAHLPEDDEREAFIRRRDRSFGEKADDGAAKRLATEVKDRLQLYADETAKLKAQETEYDRYGKLLDKTAEATARVDIATGKFAAASGAVKAQILAAAQAEDVQAEKTKQAEIAAQAAAEAAKKRETAAAELKKRLAEESIATDVQIEKLQEETRSLGLNTVARQIAAEQLKIEKQRRDALADPKNTITDSSPNADANDRRLAAAQTQAIADQINAAALDRSRKIAEALTANDVAVKSFGYGAQRAFAAYAQDASNAAKFSEEFIGNGLKRTEDAIVQFVKTGKLSFRDLFTSMADEWLRQQVRMTISKGLGGGLVSGIGGIFGSLFAANTGAAASAASSLPGDSLDNFIGLTAGFGTMLATGTNYVSYDGMPATLHQGEAVVPAMYNPAAGGRAAGGHVFDFSGQTINVGRGVSRGEVAAAVREGNAQNEARIRRLLKQGAIG